ncbi:hypothetical protein PG911_02460 [Tenacibaculum ovolyticum]|uniref:hypothetical protein n=1 Tax=Tenacibaculum ovolyticum TaxID=104270 RepID=UPI0022F3E537|nr:hypothetical protein [Tenacibaculum ovolyticum]WBX77142.1 hypothetical protein PG911_02460 [Tenacibaculum ovolyticum]
MKNPKVATLFKSLILLGLNITFLSCESNDEQIVSNLDALVVKIASPTNTQVLYPNQNVEFVGQISSVTINGYSNYNIEWSSNIDGILHQGKLDSNGISKFNRTNLSKDIHNIRFTVSNEINETIYDESIIYNSIWVYPLSDENSKAKISWSKTNDSNFDGYLVYRSRNKNDLLNRSQELIHTSSNIQDTTFTYDKAYLGDNYFYRVFLKRSSVVPTHVGSNIDSITLGNFIKTDYPIEKIIKHPNKPYAYGIVNTNSIYDENASGYGLVFINTNNQKIEKRILSNTRFSDMDISGDYLFLCSKSNVIHKINLNDNELESTLSLARPAHKIKIGSNNRLYYHITPPTSGSTEFRIYNLSTSTDITYNSTISDAYSSFSHGDFELDSNNTIYHGESNSSSSNLSKITTTNDVFGLVEQWSSGRYQSPLLILNNDKLFWNNLLLDTNLNWLGDFSEDNQEIDIDAVSPNGELALGLRRIFLTENQTISRYIPVIYNTATFIDDKNLILIKNDKQNSNKYETTIYFYNLE